VNPTTSPDPGDVPPARPTPLLAAHRARQQASRTAQLAQAVALDVAQGSRLAPGDGTFNAAAAAVLTQWKEP
jgi:hypothetical protein